MALKLYYHCWVKLILELLESPHKCKWRLGTTDSSGSHTHSSNAVGGTIGLITSNGDNTANGGLDTTSGEPNLYTSPQELTINSNGAHTHSFTTGSTGSGSSFNIIQPTIFVSNIFIYSH